MSLETLPPLRDHIKTFGLAARYSLGQNFLLDLNLTGKIARVAGTLDQGTTIEIGPGPGGLTRALLLAGVRKLIVIEKDHRAIQLLQEIASHSSGRLIIIEGDALTMNLENLGESPRRIVANLPYNISTALLLRWLYHPSSFESFTLLFQKEVVDRLIASPGTSDYGRLSVISQWLCEIKPQFNIPPEAFTPSPKVTSTLVRLIPRQETLAMADRSCLEAVTQAAFGQRRKMLRSSLKSLGNAHEILQMAQIEGHKRAEELTITDFCSLARAFSSLRTHQSNF
jgi:16S rRNA (adenine1518-N6/adenine1519-N6)-dimethyltransferase